MAEYHCQSGAYHIWLVEGNTIAATAICECGAGPIGHDFSFANPPDHLVCRCKGNMHGQQTG